MLAPIRFALLVLPFAAACSSARKTVPANAGEVDIGYGTVDRDDATGAVSSADRDEFGRTHYTRVEEMIAARFPGVDVRANGDGTYSIQIRSSTSFNSGTEPLVVVDGVPAIGGVGVLAAINPNDVRQIDVLRDAASAAIYGSRGANGVILISTRNAGD
jgi:TonB-dependent SusC/RagA subfamily outer membrane receptor